MTLPPIPDSLDAIDSMVIAEFDADGELIYANAGMRRLTVDNTSHPWHVFAEPLLTTFTLPRRGTAVLFEGHLTVNGPGDRISALRGCIEASPTRLRVVAGYDMEAALGATDTLMDLNQALIDAQRALARSHHELARREETIRQLSLADTLTGIANRRALDAHTEEALARCARNGEVLWLFMIDVDHFKAVNDTFGHAVGDQVLAAFASQLRDCLRQGDFIARLGGEEFVILVPNASREAVAAFAERLRRAIAAGIHPDVGRVTASLGVAGSCPGERADALFARADAALYRAKSGGRNRVEIAAAPDGLV